MDLETPTTGPKQVTSRDVTTSNSVYSCEVAADHPDWIGDGVCDHKHGLNVADCGWDGGDCCESTCVAGIFECGQLYDFECLDPDGDHLYCYDASVVDNCITLVTHDVSEADCLGFVRADLLSNVLATVQDNLLQLDSGITVLDSSTMTCGSMYLNIALSPTISLQDFKNLVSTFSMTFAQDEGDLAGVHVAYWSPDSTTTSTQPLETTPTTTGNPGGTTEDPDNNVDVSTPTPSWFSEDNMTMWIIIGVVAVVVILLVVLIVVCCKRRATTKSRRVAFDRHSDKHYLSDEFSGRSPSVREFEMSPRRSVPMQPVTNGATLARDPRSAHFRTTSPRASPYETDAPSPSHYDHYSPQASPRSTQAPRESTSIGAVTIDGFESPSQGAAETKEERGSQPSGAPIRAAGTSPTYTSDSYLQFYHENAKRLEDYFNRVNKPRFIKKIPKILLRNRGKEEKLFRMLVVKYGGELNLSPRSSGSFSAVEESL